MIILFLDNLNLFCVLLYKSLKVGNFETKLREEEPFERMVDSE